MTSDAQEEAETVEEQGKYGKVQFTYYDIEERHRTESQSGYVLVRGAIGIVVGHFGMLPTRGRRLPVNSHNNPYQWDRRRGGCGNSNRVRIDPYSVFSGGENHVSVRLMVPTTGDILRFVQKISS